MGALAYVEKYTSKDYEQWEGDWELIYGDPYAMSPSPMVTHQGIILKIARQLDEQLDNCPICIALLETDWSVSEDTVVRPDVMVVCNQEGERVYKTPEIIFEVVSDSSAKRDEILKFELYKDEGVKYYSIIYPKMKKGKLYKLVDGKYQKIGDFINETAELEIEGCNISLDFKKIWGKWQS